MVTQSISDDSGLNDLAARRRASAALWLGFDYGMGNVERLDEPLTQLAAEIHPNHYIDLRTELAQVSVEHTSSHEEQSPYLPNGKFLSLCRLGLASSPTVLNCFLLGRRFAVSIAYVNRIGRAALNCSELSKFLTEIPSEIVARSETLSKLTNSLRHPMSTKELAKKIVRLAPKQCRTDIPMPELVFHVLYKLVSAAVSPCLGETQAGTAQPPVNKQGRESAYATEPPQGIGENFFGPVVGSQKNIANWMGMGTRTIKKKHRDGTIWLCQVHGTRYEVYFRTERRFQEVLRRSEARLRRHETA